MNGPVSGGGRDDMTGGGRRGAERWERDGEWLTEVLDSEFGRYEPDTQRIRTLLDERMEGGAAERAVHGRNPVVRLRLAGIPAGIAAAALCATVAVGVTATVTGNHPDSTPNAATTHGGLPAAGDGPTGGNGRSAAGSPGAGTHGTVTGQAAGTATKPAGADASPSASPSASTSTPASSTGAPIVAAAGSLAPTSNAQWSEEDVNITLADPITALQLVVRVAPSAGLASAGFWSNHDITKFDVSVNSDANGLVYRFTLKPGNSIDAGAFTIAAQFTHSGQRDASGDTFAVNVTTDQAHGSASAVSQGSF